MRIRLPKSLTEKTVDNYVGKIKKDSARLGLCYEEVLQNCIFESEKLIRYYKKIKERQTNYSYSGYLLASAIGFSMACVGYLDLCTYKKITKRLDKQGVQYIHLDGCVIAPCSTGTTESDLSRLAYTTPWGDVFLSIPLGIVGGTWFFAIGMCEMLDQRYCNEYYQKYCFIKKRLEWHLEKAT